MHNNYFDFFYISLELENKHTKTLILRNAL